MKNYLKSAALVFLLLFGMNNFAAAQGSTLSFRGAFTAAGGSRLPFKSFYLYLDESTGNVRGYFYNVPLGSLRMPSVSFTGRADRSGAFTGSFAYNGVSYTLNGSFNRRTRTVFATTKQYRTSRIIGIMLGQYYTYRY